MCTTAAQFACCLYRPSGSVISSRGETFQGYEVRNIQLGLYFVTPTSEERWLTTSVQHRDRKGGARTRSVYDRLTPCEEEPSGQN